MLHFSAFCGFLKCNKLFPSSDNSIFPHTNYHSIAFAGGLPIFMKILFKMSIYALQNSVANLEKNAGTAIQCTFGIPSDSPAKYWGSAHELALIHLI